MRTIVVAGALAGCSFSASLDGADASAKPQDACVTYSEQLDTCTLVPGPTLELSGTLEFSTLTGMLVDKTTGELVAVTSQMLSTKEEAVTAILAANVTFAPGTTLRAIGPRGFAILATDSIQLGTNALIDVGDNGAGAHVVPCAGGPAEGEDDTGGAGGGGGAGFADAGGPGGDGNDDSVFGESAGGRGGMPLAAPAGPRGGCPGAAGGDGNEVGGTGGRGGGAVWLAAGALVELADGAGINAGGSGGGGGIRTGSQGDAGGGGGGSGGVIWIEAPRVRSMGILAANGGGGGEGSGGDAPGMNGTPGLLALTRAPGGTGGSSSGAAGGAGGHRDGTAGLVAANPEAGGGGGGGGSVGFIRVLSPDKSVATSSP